MKLKFLLLTFSMLVALIIAEIALRIVGYAPGARYKSMWFEQVDTLKSFHGFAADSDGIFKAEPRAADVIAARLAAYTPDKLAEGMDVVKPDELYELYSIAEDFVWLNDLSLKNEFSDELRRMKAKPPAQQTDLDSAILHYSHYPVNAEGFKSIPFKTYTQCKKKVLLLGDSFTWGHSTTQKTNSFADILLARGYAVYNTGISGADPAQYLAIAQKYIPLLQPDVVVVNFFLGNDIYYFRREVKPYAPIFYATNAGNLYTCNDGIYLPSAEAAYEHGLNSINIPVENNWFNKLCATTSVTTLLWRVLEKLKWVNGHSASEEAYWKEATALWQQKPYSNVQVDSIRIWAETYHSKFLLVAIPDILGGASSPNEVDYLFENIPYHLTPVDLKKGYKQDDGHFNDEGHRQHAAFLEKLLEAE